MVKMPRCSRCSRLLLPWEITTCGRCLTKLIKAERAERTRKCFARGKKKKGKK